MMVDSYNIPLLISWIQIILFFFLLLLFCVFGIFSSDISDNNSVPSTSSSSLSRRFLSVDPTPISHHGLGISVPSNQIEKGEIRPAATSRVTRIEEEEEEEETLLEKDKIHNFHHPCNFLERAGSVFLKCFGLHQSNEETEDSLKPELKKHR